MAVLQTYQQWDCFITIMLQMVAQQAAIIIQANQNYQCGGLHTQYIASLCSTSGWYNGYLQCSPGYSLATNNATGFGAVAAGYYDGSSYQTSGYYGYYWSSYKSSTSGYCAKFNYFSYNVSTGTHKLGNAASVRCVKN